MRWEETEAVLNQVTTVARSVDIGLEISVVQRQEVFCMPLPRIERLRDTVTRKHSSRCSTRPWKRIQCAGGSSPQHGRTSTSLSHCA